MLLKILSCDCLAGPEEMTHWHPGGRFKESFSSNGFHIIYSIVLLRIISRYLPFLQMSFWCHLTFIRNKILVYIIPQFPSFDPYRSETVEWYTQGSYSVYMIAHLFLSFDDTNHLELSYVYSCWSGCSFSNEQQLNVWTLLSCKQFL